MPRLYRQYTATVLKETRCSHCGQVADKYIEYDPVLVLLDLVLLNRQAIRHILYNTAFRHYWKLCVVMVLIEGYVTYCGVQQAHDADPWHGLASPLDSPQLDGERQFYVICVESLVAAAAFLAVTALGCRALGQRVPVQRLAKALVLGSFSVFLWVPALVWTLQDGGPARRWVDAAFIGGYTFLGLTQTVSVLCSAPRPAAALVAALGLGAKAAARNALRALDDASDDGDLAAV